MAQTRSRFVDKHVGRGVDTFSVCGHDPGTLGNAREICTMSSEVFPHSPKMV